MTPDETAGIWRMVRAICPQQATDEYGPDAWHLILEPYRFEDCREAIRALGTRQPFIAPSEVVGEVRKIRSKRIADRGDELTPPPGLSDAEELAWLGWARRMLGDGEPMPAEARELRPRHLPDLRELMPRIDADHDETARAALRAARHKPDPTTGATT